MSHSLSAAAELAVKYVNTTQRQVFLTGKAGSGKTTLLKYIVENTYKNTVVAAPTGIAAINAGGVTLHSLLQLPFGTFVPEEMSFLQYEMQERVNTPRTVISQQQMAASKRKLLREIELLIIDEVSMLRADLLDCIDLVLRHVRRKRGEPFGGVQVLFIGDLNQLPPVVKHSEWPLLSKYYKSAYFFDAQVLQRANPVFIELDKIYRQSDQKFLGILNRLRDNELHQADIKILNSHFDEDYSVKSRAGYIHITTHNRKAEVINQRELKNLEARARSYNAKVSGEFPEHMYPLPETLVLKKGAQVMFIKNDPSGEGQFYNGKIGHIVSLGHDHIDVKLKDPERLVHVDKYAWENKRYTLNSDTGEVEEKVIGSFEQYPIKLAWAITVHKSQGLTFEKAILDLSDSFAPGQMYVALSRLTSMDGLVLSTPIPGTDFEQDEALVGFIERKKKLEELMNDLHVDRRAFLLAYGQKAFDFADLTSELGYHLKSFDKEENRSKKQKYLSWTQSLIKETYPLEEVARKFMRQLAKIVQGEAEHYSQTLHERVVKAENYFLPLLEQLSDKVKAHKKDVHIQKQVKGYTKELKALQSLYDMKKLRIQKAVLLISRIADNKILTKKELHDSAMYEQAKSTSKKEKKKEKTPTREISFNLYKEGKNVEAIAEQRGLTTNTIEGHLCAYIATGQVKAVELMEETKIDNILTVAKTLDTNILGEIKEKLGDEYGYSEIKIALAHQEAVSSSENVSEG